jgi:hypothetical protein
MARTAGARPVQCACGRRHPARCAAMARLLLVAALCSAPALGEPGGLAGGAGDLAAGLAGGLAAARREAQTAFNPDVQTRFCSQANNEGGCWGVKPAGTPPICAFSTLSTTNPSYEQKNVNCRCVPGTRVPSECTYGGGTGSAYQLFICNVKTLYAAVDGSEVTLCSKATVLKSWDTTIVQQLGKACPKDFWGNYNCKSGGWPYQVKCYGPGTSSPLCTPWALGLQSPNSRNPCQCTWFSTVFDCSSKDCTGGGSCQAIIGTDRRVCNYGDGGRPSSG